MIKLCKDFDNAVYKLVIDRLRETEGEIEVHNSLTLGFLDDSDNKIIGGVIFSLTGRCCFFTIWADSVMWCSRSNLTNIFEIAFDFGAVAIKCATNFHNFRVNKLVRGLGFRREGILRFQRPDGSDEIVWSMTKKEMKNQKWWKKEQ